MTDGGFETIIPYKGDHTWNFGDPILPFILHREWR
jgi:hypothetical protein